MGKGEIPEGVPANTVLEFLGEQITWEFLKCEGVWYVWASHHGDTDDFKFSDADKSLNDALMRVAKDLWNNGPDWVRD